MTQQFHCYACASSREMKHMFTEHLEMNNHRSIFYDDSKVETTNRLTYTQIVIQSYNGTLFSHEKGTNYCYMMSERRQTKNDSYKNDPIYTKFQRCMVAEGKSEGRRPEVNLPKGHGGTFCGNGVMVSQGRVYIRPNFFFFKCILLHARFIKNRAGQQK